MGFAIPKIQYKNVDTTGNTASGNATVSNIPDTTDIEVGMFIRGTGIPTGATVGSKTSSTVVLASGTASANGTGVALAFGYEIEFDYPPIEPEGEELNTKATSSESLSGIQQTSVNYIEATRKPKFSFISQAKYLLLKTFMQSHALLGGDFRYYEDKTLSSYVDYELDKLKWEPKKIAPVGVDVYIWEIPLTFRRAL
jgi:hypothetical protein